MAVLGSWRRWHKRLAVTGVGLVTILTAATVVAPPASAALPMSRGSGFVQASGASSEWHQSGSSIADNTSGGQVIVQRTGVGRYTVRFEYLGVAGGVAHATATGPGANYCKIAGLSSSAPDKLVSVRCFSAVGVSVDSPFNVSFTNMQTAGTGLVFAYGWVNSGFPEVLRPPAGGYWNSTGRPMEVYKLGDGLYGISMGMGLPARGHAQVTAVGDGPEHCAVLGNPTQSSVQITCWNPAGQSANVGFMLTYVDGTNILGQPVWGSGPGVPTAYGAALQSTASSYTLDAAYQFNSLGGAGGASRTGVGKYGMTFRSPSNATLAVGSGDVQLTTFGDKHCSVSGRSQVSINVSCFDRTGQPVDGKYMLSFAGTRRA